MAPPDGPTALLRACAGASTLAPKAEPALSLFDGEIDASTVKHRLDVLSEVRP